MLEQEVVAFAKHIRIPRLVEIRRGVLPDVAALLDGAGFELGSVLVCAGGRTTAALADEVAGSFLKSELRRVGELDGSELGVMRLSAELAGGNADLCIAVGGGRVIDVAKRACGTTPTPLVSIPTSLAHDGIASPISSIASKGGIRRSLPGAMPSAVIIDLDVVRRAPSRTSCAGAADLVSNLTAIEDWRLACERGEDDYDGFAALIAEQAALSLLEASHPSSSGWNHRLARGLVLSGLAMEAAGSSRPCSGSEHLVSHRLDRIPLRNGRLHGEQVALGTLVAAAAQGGDVNRIKTAFESWGVPTTARQLGLTVEHLTTALIEAPSMRPDRYTVFNELSLSGAEARTLLAEAGVI